MAETATPTPALPATPGWLRPAVIALVLANLIPLAGVLIWRWEVFPLLLLFWMENVLIGIFNVCKMLLAAPAQPLTWAAKLFFVPFFSFHYGMFTFVHGVFVMGMFGGAFRQGAPFPNATTVWQLLREQRLEWAILGLLASHAISFGWNYVGQGEYRRASLPALMTQPYGRVVVLHLTVLLGGFLVMALESPTAGLALLVLLKTGLDVRAHLRERKQFAPVPP